MEIQFTNIDNLWVAEFEVTKDFNLHLERDTEGRLDIYQRTAGGDYEYIYDIGYLNKRTVYDNDFQALVYPKWIKIKSAVKPLVATITTDGEVNEVVYQAKDIEITSNGTTKVTADTGYTALGSVNVKVNVPTEGGGSGVEADDILYIVEAYFKAAINLSKATALVFNENGTDTVSIEDGYMMDSWGNKTSIVNMVYESSINNNLFVSIKEEKILHISDSFGVMDSPCADSGITVVCERYINDDSDETEEITGTLIYQVASSPLVGINVNDSIVIMDSNFIEINKIIASNGREYILQE